MVFTHREKVTDFLTFSPVTFTPPSPTDKGVTTGHTTTRREVGNTLHVTHVSLY